MDYATLLEKMYIAFPMYHKIGTSAYKEGLENIEILADMAGHPEFAFPSIHIAGTNGKGSVAHLLSSLFQELGLKTGLYTSPHLVDFNERIRINGEPIAEKDILTFYNLYEERLQEIAPSFFEMTTMMAFHFFAKEKVDIAIIETGLGGRLDATNIISPDLSVITNISFDHTALLGNDIAKIAEEKAGIIKPGIPVVIGEYHDKSYPVFQQKASTENAPLFLAENLFRVEKEQKTLSSMQLTIFRNGKKYMEHVSFPLMGEYQLKNIVTFLQCTELLKEKYPITLEIISRAIENVLSNTHFRGRWTVIKQNPLIICDAGHNQGAFAALSKQLSNLSYKKLHIVFGVANDKDIDSILPLLPRESVYYYLCKANIDRSLSPEMLQKRMEKSGFNTSLFYHVKDAYFAAVAKANKEDVVFVGGSCFVVGDLFQVIDAKI